MKNIYNDGLPTYKEIYPENEFLPKYFDLFPKDQNIYFQSSSCINDNIEKEAHSEKTYIIYNILKNIKIKKININNFDQITSSLLIEIIKKNKKLKKIKNKILFWKLINFIGCSSVFISSTGVFITICVTIASPGTFVLMGILASCSLLFSSVAFSNYIYIKNKLIINYLKNKQKKINNKIKDLIYLINLDDINKK